MVKRYEDMLAGVKEHIALTDAEKAEHEAKFKKIAGPDSLLSMNEYRVYAEEMIGERKPALNAALKKQEVDNMVARMAAKDQDGDGNISLDEFYDAQLFFKIEETFAAKNTDGDVSKMSDAELLEWIREWTIRDADLVGMKKVLMLAEETELTTDSLAEAMYRTIVPDFASKVNRVMHACRRKFKFDDVMRSNLYQEFNLLSGGKDFIPVTLMKKRFKETLKRLLGTPAQVRIGRRINEGLRRNSDRAKNEIEKLDPNNDGNVSRREFERMYKIFKVIRSLADYGADSDDLISRRELVAWLQSVCGLADDAEGCCDALMKLFKAKDGTLVKADFLLELSERAFPSDYSYTNWIGKAIRTVFALNEVELEEETKKFKAMAGESPYISADDFKNNVKEFVVSKFRGAAAKDIEEVIDSLQGQEGDEKVSLHDFCSGRLRRKFTASFTNGCGEDGLLDMEELKQWLSSELKIPKSVGVSVIALKYMFMPDVNCRASPPDVFINGLFAMAFPPTKVFLRKVVKEIMERFAPSEEEEDMMRTNVYRLSRMALQNSLTSSIKRPRGSIPMIDYRKFIVSEVDQNDEIASEMKGTIKKALMDAATEHDENNDDIITSEEFVRGEIYKKMLCSLHSVNADGDFIMDKPELVVWLKETLDLDDACYTEAVLETFMPKDAVELPIDVLLGGLMAEAFPSDARRIKDFISAIRVKYGIPDTPDLKPEDVSVETVMTLEEKLSSLMENRDFDNRGYDGQSCILSDWISAVVDNIDDPDETAKALINNAFPHNQMDPRFTRRFDLRELFRYIMSEVTNDGRNANLLMQMQMQRGHPPYRH
ncbi:uncharacterized protein LOC135496160 [Lineus longissimus]|uniref:uncharacterized protein LOC135496160 n=1 Tax=Lineus longissimus TaxID=88925 RepID=UPI002B4E7A9A